MANPYQIEDWESMASVRSKLNQMGEAVENSIQNPTWWTEWQVLTKTETWTEWQDSKWKEIFYVERYDYHIWKTDTTYSEAEQAYRAWYELVYRYNWTASDKYYKLISVDDDIHPTFYFWNFHNSQICKLDAFTTWWRTFYNLVTSSSITQISKVDSVPTSPSNNTLYVITE